jgi:DNA invertase Pin-like site-specific DNA recombinase
VRTGEADGIVVSSLDRLARSLTVQEATLAKVWAHGGTVLTTDQGEVPRDDPDDPMRTAVRQIVGVMAELDRKLVVKRLRQGRATKVAVPRRRH